VQELSRAEAAARAGLIRVDSYEIDLDFIAGPEIFRSITRIRFACLEPGASSFVELSAPTVHQIELNGRTLDVAEVYADERVSLPALGAENELTVVADCAYSSTSEGVHRFVDPADGLVYVHSSCEPFDAHRIFACFDQPDLTARVTTSVAAPPEWTVVANAAGVQVAPGRWEFEPTKPISTYLVAIAAGSYHSVTAQHDGIPLGLHCPRSLAPHLDADEILEITRQCFDYFQAIFGVRYPFGKYDQVFSPEFPGAMEHPGCVTFGDHHLFRSRATETARLGRASTIAHEMAHMWFGDLVTMRWWDDLWLKESFADFAGTLALAEATRFTDAWTDFSLDYKPWGYRQDQLPSTHPISADVLDTAGARLNFDGISYAKGASVLRQLVAWVGLEPFLAGLRRYIVEYAYGTATLSDLLRELEKTSGRDLQSWSDDWLRTAGVNTLRPRATLAQDGRYGALTIEQGAPSEHPTLRSHRLALGLYDRADGRLARRARLELDVSGSSTDVPALRGAAPPDLLLLNDGDLTWAKVRLDERSLRAVLEGGLRWLSDPLTRAVLWGSVWDMTRDGELGAGEYARIVLDALPAETKIGTVETVAAQVREAVDRFGDPLARHERMQRMARRFREMMEAADPGGDPQLACARAYVSAVSEADDSTVLQRWLAGVGIPDGLAIDADLRWHVLTRLAVIGAIGESEIAAEYARDTTANGERFAARARASLPTAEAKAHAWEATMEARDTAEHLIRPTASGFWQPEQRAVTEPYVARYFREIRAACGERAPSVVQQLTRLLYPWVVTEPSTIELTDTLLGRADLDPFLRRGLVEQRDDLARALRARQLDASAGPVHLPEDESPGAD